MKRNILGQDRASAAPAHGDEEGADDQLVSSHFVPCVRVLLDGIVTRAVSGDQVLLPIWHEGHEEAGDRMLCRCKATGEQREPMLISQDAAVVHRIPLSVHALWRQFDEGPMAALAVAPEAAATAAVEGSLRCRTADQRWYGLAKSRTRPLLQGLREGRHRWTRLAQQPRCVYVGSRR